LAAWPPRQLERFSSPFPSHVSVALYPATSESEKVSFNQLNRKTRPPQVLEGRRDTGEEAAAEDIVKVDTDAFIEVTKEELENSRRTRLEIEIDEFVDRSEIDPRLPDPSPRASR